MAEEQKTAGCSEESCASCASAGTCTSKKVDMHEPMNMYSSIKKVIGVVSGKGGVGKSLVTASLARMMRAKAVSYTHLDVYKRQVCDRGAGSDSGSSRACI